LASSDLLHQPIKKSIILCPHFRTPPTKNRWRKYVDHIQPGNPDFLTIPRKTLNKKPLYNKELAFLNEKNPVIAIEMLFYANYMKMTKHLFFFPTFDRIFLWLLLI
jgi:hypothetical protein